MNQLNLEALGATEEVFDQVKNDLPELNKKAKKLKYKPGNEVECFEVIEGIQKNISKLSILIQMKSNDNKDELYIEAEKWLNRNFPKDNNLKKSIYDKLGLEKIKEIAKKNSFSLIPYIFINFQNTIKGFISNGTMLRLVPSALKLGRISKKSDEITNKYKTFVGKIMVDNKEKSNDEIIKLVLEDAKDKQNIYLSASDEELKLNDKIMKVFKKFLKIKKTNNPEFDFLNTFNLYDTFKPITEIYKGFEKFAIRNRDLNKMLLEKTHGKNADSLNLEIDAIKNQPTPDIDELKEMYIEALSGFDPEIAEFARKNTTAEGRYDFSVRETKPTNMAFTLMSEDCKGYVSSHYDKTLNWQTTIAHEWGHSIQLERSGTNMDNMEWQPILVEKPSILSEYIYLEHLKKKTRGTKKKLAIVDELLSSALSRFYKAPLGLRFGEAYFKEYEYKLNPKEAYEFNERVRNSVGYKDLTLESKMKKYTDDLRRFDTPPVQLYQYIAAQAIAIMMYIKLKDGEIKLSDVYDNPLKTTDLIEYCKTYGIDITSPNGFNSLFGYVNDLLDEKEKLIKKIK